MTSEQIDEIRGEIMNEQEKLCRTCEFWYYMGVWSKDDHVCVNGYSDQSAEYTNPDDTCAMWEGLQ